MKPTPEPTAIGIDPDALEAFYREHVAAVQRFVARRVADPERAADLTADIFLAALDAAGSYRPAGTSPAATEAPGWPRARWLPAKQWTSASSVHRPLCRTCSPASRR